MSVRPRTLVVGAAPSAGGAAFYKRLIPRFDYVVAVDGGAALCIEAGRSPDVVIGDFDSLDPSVRAECARLGVREEVFPAEKDTSDLDLALAMLAAQEAWAVTITACWAGRLDHTLAAIGSAVRQPRLIVDLVDPDMRGWVLDGHGRASLSLRPAGATVSIIAVMAAARVSCTGMRYPLDEDTLAPLSTRGLSNVIADEEARVVVHGGTVAVLSPRTDGIVATSAEGGDRGL